MRSIITLSVIACLLFGCQSDKQPEEVKNSSNDSYKVEMLFEIDGVTVYRFLDNGRYIYFTNRDGEAGYTYRQRSGGRCVTKRVYTLCN